eukprot:gene4996-9995_t
MNILAFPVASISQDLDSSSIRAIENITRVKYSLHSVQDDIDKGSDAKAIINEVKALLQNYRLKDSLKTATELSGSKRSDARDHANNAFEDLSSVFEYMSDNIDDVSGNRIPPREILTFTQQATSAADKELGLFLSDLPSEIVNSINSQVADEFSATKGK